MTDWTNETYDFTGPLYASYDSARSTHRVHVKGDGPPILILQELPGIGPETLALADRLIAAGFRVHLPHLFGTFGKVTLAANTVRLFCVRREINMFLRGRQSPIAAWIAALAAHIRDRDAAIGVGVIGMCLTGHFALAAMAEDAVIGGVASQPALPALGRGALQMSAEDIARARAGMAERGPGLAMRFADDRIASERLMQALERAFGDTLETVRYPGRGHSLLTLDFHEPAYQRTEGYFRARFGLPIPASGT